MYLFLGSRAEALTLYREGNDLLLPAPVEVHRGADLGLPLTAAFEHILSGLLGLRGCGREARRH